jgi:HEAT repeat protein
VAAAPGHRAEAERILRELEDGEVSPAFAQRRLHRLERAASVAAVSLALARARIPRVRRILCDVLATRKDPAGLDALLAALDDPDAAVRAAAADAIGKVFGYVDSPPLEHRDRTLAALTSRWRVEEAASVRSTLAQTLALLGDPAVRPLLAAALDDPDRMVRGQSRWGLDYLEREHPTPEA